MKKSVKALNAFAGLVLAAGLAFSGCSGLADLEDSASSQTASFGRAAYAATSGMQGSISSVNVRAGSTVHTLHGADLTILFTVMVLQLTQCLHARSEILTAVIFQVLKPVPTQSKSVQFLQQ